MEWFECKVRYDKALDNGLTKQVTESYLVDALSFTEAEHRFIEEIEPFMSSEFLVTDIKRAKIAEMFESVDTQADRWFKCKVAYITIDEKSGVEKRTNQMMMVQAIDLRDAVRALDKGMEGTLGDYVIVSVTETAIMDVYHHRVDDDEKPAQE